MFKSTIVALLSLSMAFSAYAAPIAIPFTGLSADIHMERRSFPTIEVRAVGGKTTGH